MEYELYKDHWSGGSLTIQTSDREKIKEQWLKALTEFFDGETNVISLRLVKE